jgi:hypothetical protein
VKSRKMMIAVLTALRVAALPLSAPAENGRNNTRVYIGGSFYLGPPAWGPAYDGPGYRGPRCHYPPPAYYAPAPVIVHPAPQYVERGQGDADYWYYCENPRGYSPHARPCPGGWMRVVPDTVPPGC